jgi:iron complex transport system substrate-binding protein
MAETRRWTPAIAMLLAAAAIAAAVHRFGAPEGGLRIDREGEGDGSAHIRVGGPGYPRVAVDSAGYTVRIPRPARRIVSHYWSIDEFLYSIVPPERVVGVSESAYERRISNVHMLAERFRPIVAGDAEMVLRLNPDLVLVAGNARGDFNDLLRGAGVPVYRVFTMFTTLAQVAETMRLIGYLTGEDAAAAERIARFWTEIGRARARRPPGAPAVRILGMGGRFTYGRDTLFDDILTALGAVNVGAEGGLRGYAAVDSERIVRWNPDWIVAGADRGAAGQVRARLLEDPGVALTNAAKNGRILVVENNVFLPMSPFTTRLVDAIAEAIYE